MLAGNRQLQIKACALSNGFWHMGKFAALYAAQFGEAPSMTLARARAAAAMKSGATHRIRLGLGPKAHDNALEATRSSRRIHGAACNYQRNWECMTVSYGR